jgi:hypothetical protein
VFSHCKTETVRAAGDEIGCHCWFDIGSSVEVDGD